MKPSLKNKFSMSMFIEFVSSSKKPNAPFARIYLPLEIQLKIVSYLSLKDLHSLALVSRSVHQLALLWQAYAVDKTIQQIKKLFEDIVPFERFQSSNCTFSIDLFQKMKEKIYSYPEFQTTIRKCKGVFPAIAQAIKDRNLVSISMQIFPSKICNQMEGKTARAAARFARTWMAGLSSTDPFFQSTKLEFNQLELTSIPPELSQYFSHLTCLEVKLNPIKVLPSHLCTLPLQILCLIHNEIEKIPEEIEKLTSLKYLYLCDNRIQKIPSQIKQCTSLELLDLSKNHIQHFPPAVTFLLNLKSLSFSRNQIQEIPDTIGNLSKLESLSLDYNQIETLPREICLLKSTIKTIDLTNNFLRFTDSSVLYFLESLKEKIIFSSNSCDRMWQEKKAKNKKNHHF